MNQFIKAIDKDGDQKISKPELFEILKKLISGWWSCSPLNETHTIIIIFHNLIPPHIYTDKKYPMEEKFDVELVIKQLNTLLKGYDKGN